VGPAGSIVVEDNGPGFGTHEIADLLQPSRKAATRAKVPGLARHRQTSR